MIIIIENIEFEIDDTAKEIFDMLYETINPIIINGYLARKDINGKIDFFHRNYFTIKNTEYLVNLVRGFGHVHHIDSNKRNNKLSNLIMLSKEEHEQIHKL